MIEKKKNKLPPDTEKEKERQHMLASLRPLLEPRSVAVIGASRRPDNIGHLVFKCIIQNRYSGVVYPVNPSAEAILAVRAYPSVSDIPGEVDLGVIAVPAPMVTRVAQECGRKGIKAIIVISDGFRERGTPEGTAMENELREVALKHGMRLVGPNCMGIINTAHKTRLNASFSPFYPPQGNVGFLSQSGAMGLAVLDYAETLGLGISSFVSVGNRADVSSNDMLQYWENDEATRVILLYLESFGNPRRFSRIARRTASSKPIVAVKSGRTPAGLRAASSHTGALATTEIASDALFHQTGIIRTNTLEELFDVASLLSNQPVPRGNRVVIVTNGGGPGIIAADACEQQGLVLPELSEQTVEKLKGIIKRDISIANPLDMTAGASEEEFEQVLKVIAADPDTDSTLAIFIPPVIVDPKGMEATIERVAPTFHKGGKTLLACMMGHHGLASNIGSAGKIVPSYSFPEAAVGALAKAVEYGIWREQPKGSIPQIEGIDRRKAQRIIDSALASAGLKSAWLSAKDTEELLKSYGIRMAAIRTVTTAADAARAARKVGFPVAVKLASDTITHKTDVGGVALNLESEDAVEWAFRNIESRLAALGRAEEMQGVIVQHMVGSGIEAIAGVTQDPSFGPLIMFGLGGIYAELLNDISVRLHPLTDLDAKELIGSIKATGLFQGYRGQPPGDIAALEDLLLRISALVEDIPHIAEMDLNPIKVMPKGEGCWVVDARIMLLKH